MKSAFTAYVIAIEERRKERKTSTWARSISSEALVSEQLGFLHVLYLMAEDCATLCFIYRDKLSLMSIDYWLDCCSRVAHLSWIIETDILHNLLWCTTVFLEAFQNGVGLFSGHVLACFTGSVRRQLRTNVAERRTRLRCPSFSRMRTIFSKWQPSWRAFVLFVRSFVRWCVCLQDQSGPKSVRMSPQRLRWASWGSGI